MSGFGWYRAKLLIPAGAPPLVLLIPRFAVRTNYQVFADGKPVGGCSESPVAVFHVRPLSLCPLTASIATHDQTMLIAIRVWHRPHWAAFTAGGIVTPLRVGGAAQLQELAQFAISQRAWQYATVNDPEAILYGLAGLSAVAFYLLRHREKEHLWFGVHAMISCVAGCFWTYSLFHAFGIERDTINSLLGVPKLLALISFYRSFLNLRRDWRYWIAAGGVTANLVATVFMLNEWSSTAWANGLDVLCFLPAYVWIAFQLIRRAVEGFPDARLLLVPAILNPLIVIASYLFWIFEVLGWMKTPDWVSITFHWPFPFNLGDLSDFIFLNAVIAILLLRFDRANTQGERLAAEVEAARAAQQVLIPETIASPEGYLIRSAYKPAGDLSGDFFQVLPSERGGALLVLGDVSGKGLKAAMTGTLTIGALRTAAASGLGPGAVLSELNR
jgi:hypothetical protein